MQPPVPTPPLTPAQPAASGAIGPSLALSLAGWVAALVTFPIMRNRGTSVPTIACLLVTELLFGAALGLVGRSRGRIGWVGRIAALLGVFPAVGLLLFYAVIVFFELAFSAAGKC